jgi:hypothetical protein
MLVPSLPAVIQRSNRALSLGYTNYAQASACASHAVFVQSGVIIELLLISQEHSLSRNKSHTSDNRINMRGYVFSRIACSMPASRADRDGIRKWIQQVQTSARIPVLEAFNWLSDNDSNLTSMSLLYPTVIFLVCFTSDAQELKWFTVNNGSMSKKLDICIPKHLMDDVKHIKKDRAYGQSGTLDHRVIGSAFDLVLQAKIAEFDFYDLSKYMKRIK